MRTLFGIGVLAVLLVGCFIITGSTQGYSVVDSGTACTSASDCGDASLICCVTLTTDGPVAACQDTCTGSTSAQFCATNAECKTTGTCLAQQCSLAPDAGTIKACALITQLGCKSVDVPPDAATPDAATDAGPPSDAASDASASDGAASDGAASSDSANGDSAISDASTGG